MSKTQPDPRRSAAAKRGWEKRRQNQAKREEVERASYPPPYFYPSTTGRQGLSSASSYASVQTLMNQHRSWQAIAATAIADRVMKLEPIVVVETRISNGTVKFEELDDHPLKRVLENPNRTFSMKMLLRLISLWLTQVGDAYSKKAISSGNLTIRIYVGPNGNRNDTKVFEAVDRPYQVGDAVVSLANIRVQPSSGDKLGLSFQASGNGGIVYGNTTAGQYSTVCIKRSP